MIRKVPETRNIKHNNMGDSQGLSNLVPNLSLEDHIYQAEDLISLSQGPGPRGVSPDTVRHARSASAASNLSINSLEPPTHRGRMEVLVTPASYHRTNSHQCSSMPAYPMFRRPRGQALIINIESYDNDVQERRLGTDVDVENLVELLKGLEFDVTLKRNLALTPFFREVTEFCCNKLHAEADMAIVVILSHGHDGVVYASDGQSINMEYIYEFFNNRNCPLLRGKPKFFIVQSCRGDRPDAGVDGLDDMETAGAQASPSKHLSKKRKNESVDAVSQANADGDVARARPTWEDMIIAYSTIPGYASLRDHDKGTWFVQSLVEVFMTHAHDTELVDLLRMTSERLSLFTNELGEKQTCNVEMRHLYKRIYFNPGLSPPSVNSSQSSNQDNSGFEEN